MEKVDQFEVLLCQKANLSEIKPLSGRIIVFPVESTWNDFGYRIKAQFRVNLAGFEPYEGHLFIGFFESDFELEKKTENKNTSLSRVLESFGGRVTNKSDLSKFFTLLPDISSYRTICRSFGADHAERILFSLNDLVVSKERNKELVESATQTEVFKLAFMRNSEPFYAFHNAEFVFSVNGDELDANISDNLTLKFKLEGFYREHEINLQYNKSSIIPRRIAVLIGKNGLGKSESLKAFCRGALQYSDKNISLTDSAGNRPLINRIIAISTPGETSNTFPREVRSTQKLYYRRLTLTRKGTRTIGESLVQLARNEEYIGGLSRWELFYDSLRHAFSNVDDLAVELNNQYAPLKNFNRPGSEEQRLKIWSLVAKNSDPKMRRGENYYPLSSGQLSFFKFALLCCLHIENGSFVLMDEPETHLHPNLISDFVGLLDNLLEKTNSFALIATHSAYFVREVARQQVHIFKFDRDGNYVDIIPPRLRTFGADVESISHFVFDEDVDNNLTSKIFQRVEGRSYEEIEEEIGGEVSMATLINIKDRLQKS
jgi:ABC-type cobalamin/Fe3+-siderophores transport system ATPase subunit